MDSQNIVIRVLVWVKINISPWDIFQKMLCSEDCHQNRQNIFKYFRH